VKRKPKVLFFSTGDSTRSQMAEGFLRAFAGDEVVVASTAVQSIERDPLVLEVMKEVGVDISGQRPKAVGQFLKESFNFVVTLGDPSRERLPVWPFCRNVRHWSLTDPEQNAGTPEQKRDALRRVRDAISRNVREFVSKTFPLLHSGDTPGAKLKSQSAAAGAA
jgi:arsenate reductase